MIINRIWAMPNKYTFKIEPVAQLLIKYNVGKGWIDPFSGKYSPAEITNDINPKSPSLFHLESIDFINQLNGNLYSGVLFDPPYSLEQCKRSYENIGLKFTMKDGQICGRWTELKDLISSKLLDNSYVISFGWNSEGFGKKRNFEIIEVLLIPHGSGHNDTIVTVEKKLKNNQINFNYEVNQ